MHEFVDIAEAALPDGPVRGLGNLPDTDLAVVIERATAFVLPSLEGGFGMPMIEAFRLGTPVVYSDAPARIELAAEAGVVVARAVAERLHVYGLDRSKAISSRNSAETVWQLHADL